MSLPTTFFIGRGGGAPTNATGTLVYSNSNQYNFNGNQTSPTVLTVGLGVIADFDLEFQVSPNNVTSNPWVLNNGGYSELYGFLYGIYPNSSAIAGNGIGAYGYYTGASTAMSTSGWTSVTVKVRLSASEIEVLENGTSFGVQTNYSSTGIEWDVINLGIGKSSDNSPNWSGPYDGSIRNIFITRF